MFLIEHRFCSGPLDGKSSDPGDFIGVGAVKGIVGCHDAEGSALGCQIVGRITVRSKGAILSVAIQDERYYLTTSRYIYA
jgi:hypothetical protein